MRRRKRIDWQEEIRRSEESRVRGLRWTLLSFSFVIFYLAIVKVRHLDWNLGPIFLVVGGLMAGIVIMILSSRRFRK